METGSEGGPDTGELPLSFDAWADLSARLATRTQEETFDILDEHDLEVTDWQRCEGHYARALAEDIAQGRMERARHYADTCVAEMEKRPGTTEASGEVAPAPEQIDAMRADSGRRRRHAPPRQACPASSSHATGLLLQSPVVTAPVQSSQRPPDHLAGTAMAFELPTAFRRKAAEAPPFQAGPSPLNAATAPGSTSPLGPAPTAGATLGVGSDLLSQARSTLPFDKTTGAAPRVAYPRMPMQTYASFTAELAVFPEKTAEILQKYNVSSKAARAALEEEWRGRLEAHADVKAEWEAMVATYR